MGEGLLPADASPDAADWLRASADLYEQLMVFSEWRASTPIVLRGAVTEAQDRGVVRLMSASGWKYEGRLDRYGRLRVELPLSDDLAGARRVSIARDVVYREVTVGGRTGGRLILWLTTLQDRRQLLATMQKAQPAAPGAPRPAEQPPGVAATPIDPSTLTPSRAGWIVDRGALRRDRLLRRLQSGATPVELRRGLTSSSTPKELDEEFERRTGLLRAIPNQRPEAAKELEIAISLFVGRDLAGLAGA